jgi:hypothetical protein
MSIMIFAVVVFLGVVALAEPMSALFAWFHITLVRLGCDFDPFRLELDTYAKARIFYRWGIRGVGLLWLVLVTAVVCTGG